MGKKNTNNREKNEVSSKELICYLSLQMLYKITNHKIV